MITKRLFIILSITTLFMTGCIKNDNVSNEDVDNYVEQNDKDVLEYKKVVKNDSSFLSLVVRDRVEVLEDIHLMANTIVIADEKWGEIEITKEKVNNLIIEVEASDFFDKVILLEILTKWKQGDFYTADDDHNYCWNKLGGTVGRATGVLLDEVKKLEEIFNEE